MRTAIIVALAAAATPAAAQPVTRPSACTVTISRAPDDVRAVVEAWVRAEPRCASSVDAAFDRANDPVVVEEAMFWAAIASERAGNLDEAARRLRTFVERFPSSPWLEAARAAIARVAP
jgi:TolA-binding protein